MKNNTEMAIFESSMLFSAAITASLSHEINNVLAIVNELSGLLDDFLVAAENGKEPNPERRKGVSSKIATQVERGKRYIGQLNRFAHSSDLPSREFNARENCEFTIQLCKRFARLRQVELVPALDDIAKPLSGCPFDFQHFVYRGIEIPLELANRNSSIHIILKDTADGVQLAVTCNDLHTNEPVFDVSSRLFFLETFARKTNGSFASHYEPGKKVELKVGLPFTLNFGNRNTG